MRFRDRLTVKWVVVLVIVILTVAVVWRRHSFSRQGPLAGPGRISPSNGTGNPLPDQKAKRPKLLSAASPLTVVLPPDELVSPAAADTFPRPVTTWLEAQIALSRRAFSCGSIDGVGGAQSVAGLRAFQESENLPVTGQLDPATRARLVLTAPPLARMPLTPQDLAGLQPISPTWLGKSQQTALAYETALELVAERTHAHPALIRQLNPAVDWTEITPTTSLVVPAIGRIVGRTKAAQLHLSLGDHILEARNDAGDLIAHFPVSIARDMEKRPVGVLHVTVIIPNPDYTFDPDMFSESEEGRELGRKLLLPPGPNNPVGVAWIGLDLPGYGIHGTPAPEQVGRTESHGCFRLANWDASTLVDLAWVGLPVVIDP
jgi:lipoprotein-anchoring transpeptidase ErfK/SrfK